MPEVTVEWYVILSAILFTIGALGVLIRRNALIIFMSIELMLNSANLAFVAFARQYNNLDGQIFVFFVIFREGSMPNRRWERDRAVAVPERRSCCC